MERGDHHQRRLDRQEHRDHNDQHHGGAVGVSLALVVPISTEILKNLSISIYVFCYSPLDEPRLLCLDPAGHELLPPPLGLPDGGEQEDVEDDQGHAGHQVYAHNPEPSDGARI